MLFRFAIVLVVIGAICTWMAYKEWDLALGATEKPVEIKLKDLIARGPEGNPHVILTDFVLCDNLIYETKGSSTSWTKAWAPIVPADEVKIMPGQPVQVDNIKVLLFTLNARNEAELTQRCGKPRLQALVTNKMVSLGADEKKLLTQSYPGTDFSRCLIVQEGREPAGATKLILLGGGGVVGLLGGLGLLVAGFLQAKR